MTPRSTVLVWIAIESLRDAGVAELPQPDPFQPPEGTEPLQLLEAAWAELQQVPEDPDNVVLFLGQLHTADALASVRTHYA